MKVHLELDKILTAGITEPLEEFDWVSQMVVQEKKQKDEIRICVDLRKGNDTCVHDPFLTTFTDKVLDNVGGQEAYSFTDGLSGYHQIKIMPEDRRNTTFITKWGCFQYIVTLFGLNNVRAIFSLLMLDICRRYQITLNLKKCLFCVPFGNLLHVVRRQGLMVYPMKITMILNLEALRSVKQLRATLGHIGYYRKFIKSYAQITKMMEKLLKKDVTFC